MRISYAFFRAEDKSGLRMPEVCFSRPSCPGEPFANYSHLPLLFTKNQP